MRRIALRAYAIYEARIGKMPGPALDDYAARIAAGESYVLCDAGDIVGLLVLEIDGARILIDNLAVDPDAQGRAFGATLLAFAEDRAAALGFTQVELYTNAMMHENIAWYARHGYEETRRVREKGYDRVYMAKALGVQPRGRA